MLKLSNLFLLALAAVLASACLFGGGDEPVSVSRPKSIPTATPPASLPEPILLAEASPGTQTGGGTSPGETLYTVKSGDTLLGIALQFNVPESQRAAWIAEVLKINGIAEASQLRAGQEIRLPRIAVTPRPTGTPPTPTRTATGRAGTTSTPAAPTGTRPAESPTPRPTVAGGGGTYTVVSGDYPFLIAAKLGVPQAQQAVWVEQLIALNGINPSALAVGQVLQLPAGTPIQAGTPTPTRTP